MKGVLYFLVNLRDKTLLAITVLKMNSFTDILEELCLDFKECYNPF